MGAQGTAILNFGAFPGSSHATVAVTGQASIVAGSLVEAWLRPEATADHTADEHMVETIKVFAADIIAGTGFTIHGFNTSELWAREPASQPPGSVDAAGVGVAANYLGRVGGGSGVQGRSANGTVPDTQNLGTRIYGQWTVAWVWN